MLKVKIIWNEVVSFLVNNNNGRHKVFFLSSEEELRMQQRSNTIFGLPDSPFCSYCVHSQTHMDSTTEHLSLSTLPFVLAEDQPMVPACAYQQGQSPIFLFVFAKGSGFALWLSGNCPCPSLSIPPFSISLPVSLLYLLSSPSLECRAVQTLIGITRQECGGKLLASF